MEKFYGEYLYTQFDRDAFVKAWEELMPKLQPEKQVKILLIGTPG